MGSISYLFFYKSKEELQKSTLERLEIINNLKAEKIESQLNLYEDAAQEILEISERHQDFSSLVHHPSPEQTIEHSKARNQLNAVRRAYGIHQFYILTVKSKLRYPNDIKSSQESADFVLSQLDEDDRKRKLFYSPLRSKLYKKNAISDEYFLAKTYPMKNRDGSLGGVLVCEFNMQKIYYTAEEKSGLGETGESILLQSENGTVSIISPLRNPSTIIDTLNFSTKRGDNELSKMFQAHHESPDKELVMVQTYKRDKVDLIWKKIPQMKWVLVTQIDHKESFATINKLKVVVGGLCLGILFFTIILVNLFIRQILSPIAQIRTNILAMTEGKFPPAISYPYNDEVKDATNALNKLIRRLRKATIVSEKLVSGNHDAVKRLRFNDNDVLSISLLNLKNRLEDLEKSSATSQWFSDGLAIHSEILHRNSNNLNELGEQLMQSLASHIGAQAGRFYIRLNPDNRPPYYKLIGNYALEHDDSIEITEGQGLVGQCASEKQTIYLKNAPRGYISISSGLGDFDKSKIVIVPLIESGIVVGVLEFASIGEIELYKIKFLEKLSENIAYSVQVLLSQQKK